MTKEEDLTVAAIVEHYNQVCEDMSCNLEILVEHHQKLSVFCTNLIAKYVQESELDSCKQMFDEIMSHEL